MCCKIEEQLEFCIEVFNDHLLRHLLIMSLSRTISSDTHSQSGNLHTHGVGACCYSKRLEDMFIGSLRQINTDSKTIPVGDFMQMNQHEILLGVVSKCTIRLPVSLLFNASGAAPSQLIVYFQVSTDLLQVAKMKSWSSDFLLKVSSDRYCDSDSGILALVFEPVETFIVLTLGFYFNCWPLGALLVVSKQARWRITSLLALSVS